MLKKSVLSFVLFILGILLAFFTESFFRELIRDIFQWATNDAISFYGKGIDLRFPYYYISIGIGLAIFGIANIKNKTKRFLINTLVLISTFFLSLILICIVDAHLHLASCTACDDGTMAISRGALNYDRILILNSFMTIGLYFLYFTLLKRRSIVKIQH